MPEDSISGGAFGPTVRIDDGTLVTAYSYAGPGSWRGQDLHIEVVRWRCPSLSGPDIKFWQSKTGNCNMPR